MHKIDILHKTMRCRKDKKDTDKSHLDNIYHNDNSHMTVYYLDDNVTHFWIKNG